MANSVRGHMVDCYFLREAFCIFEGFKIKKKKLYIKITLSLNKVREERSLQHAVE